MDAISTVVKQVYGVYEYVRNRWPCLTAWAVIAPMIIVIGLFTLEYPIPAIIGSVVVGAELRYARII